MTDHTALILAATCDLSGKVRGKAFPADQLKKRLQRGVGWVPTNIQITCFDGIAESPFGSLGDLKLVPDPAAAMSLTLGDGPQTQVLLGDIRHLDDTPWPFCLREVLRTALFRLNDLAGVTLNAAFEHEFQLKGSPLSVHQGFGLRAFEDHRGLCEDLMGALSAVGIAPDSIMKEFGPNQYEVVVEPAEGLRAADAAVILRELTHLVARHHAECATFVPIQDVSSVGNGVHIHFSFLDGNGAPATYDPAGPGGQSALTGAFAAGVLKYLPDILALTAPSMISYQRLTPHRWSAAYNNLGDQDREAALRICPTSARDGAKKAAQFNLEYRAADAAACPHLALAALVHAGCQGIEEGLAAPTPTTDDLSLLSAAELTARGYERLPETLEAALHRFRGNSTVQSIG